MGSHKNRQHHDRDLILKKINTEANGASKMSTAEIAILLGWCTVLNFGWLFLSLIMLSLFRRPILLIHSKLSGLTEDKLNMVYFQFMAQFKMLWIVFNLTPYLVLRLFVLAE